MYEYDWICILCEDNEDGEPVFMEVVHVSTDYEDVAVEIALRYAPPNWYVHTIMRLDLDHEANIHSEVL